MRIKYKTQTSISKIWNWNLKPKLQNYNTIVLPTLQYSSSVSIDDDFSEAEIIPVLHLEDDPLSANVIVCKEVKNLVVWCRTSEGWPNLCSICELLVSNEGLGVGNANFKIPQSVAVCALVDDGDMADEHWVCLGQLKSNPREILSVLRVTGITNA